MFTNFQMTTKWDKEGNSKTILEFENEQGDHIFFETKKYSIKAFQIQFTNEERVLTVSPRIITIKDDVQQICVGSSKELYETVRRLIL